MKITKSKLVIILTCLLVLASCRADLGKTTVEEATEIAKAYFKGLYNKDIIVEKVYYMQIDMHEYRNFVEVNDGESRYSLVLDKSNKPYFDDVKQVDAKKNLKFALIKEKSMKLGLHIGNLYKHILSITTTSTGENLGYLMRKPDLDWC